VQTTSVLTERVAVSVSDGTTMHAYVARPEMPAGKTPGILVFQEAFGVNAHIRDVTERFARLGFTGIAPELYHRTGDGFEAAYMGADELRKPHTAALTLRGLVDDIIATSNWLENDDGVDMDRVAAIGFCMGGRVAYFANAYLSLKAAVSFYGGGIAPDNLEYAKQQRSPILMFWGGIDTHIPAQQYRAVADALTAANVTHEQVVFGQADHGFFCDQRASYNAQAAHQAWALTLEFFRQYDVF
jgi:carboxymethylenebutenolidase